MLSNHHCSGVAAGPRHRCEGRLTICAGVLSGDDPGDAYCCQAARQEQRSAASMPSRPALLSGGITSSMTVVSGRSTCHRCFPCSDARVRMLLAHPVK